jgi:hypothetical protein
MAGNDRPLNRHRPDESHLNDQANARLRADSIPDVRRAADQPLYPSDMNASVVAIRQKIGGLFASLTSLNQNPDGVLGNVSDVAKSQMTGGPMDAYLSRFV